MEQNIYKRFEGPAGQVVTIYDNSRPYAYSNIFEVKLEVVGEFPDTDEKFLRTLDKLGVFIENLDETKAGLVESFEKNVLGYIFSEGFGQNLKKRNDELRKRGVL